MGNTASSSSPTSTDGKSRRNGSGGKSSRKGEQDAASTASDSPSKEKSPPKKTNFTAEEVAARAQQVVGESVLNIQQGLQKSMKTLEENDHPAAHFLDSVCGAYMDDSRSTSGHGGGKGRSARRTNSFYSEEYYSEDERTLSEDETTTTTDYRSTDRGRSRHRHDDPSVTDTASYLESDYESDGKRHSHRKGGGKGHSGRGHHHGRHRTQDKIASNSFESEEASHPRSEDNGVKPGSAAAIAGLSSKPLASSFAKRCYFTKAGIGKTTQHYEGLTLTGNVVLMLAAAMKLNGCPTICDEDLRRVEQTYPNQFSRLPDELLLSSGWRRISKYCHFSNRPIPDGIPFFHSKQRLHPTGGYFFLLAAAVGMVRPIDVEPLTRDTLVLLETDYPVACDAAPRILIEDPEQWTLVQKFCFFSGGPINTDEDVYYQADFDGNPIYMLAFLSPSLTPAELYKLDASAGSDIGLSTTQAVHEVESVYDLTERDFDDLKLYHLGPCRALPQYILQPSAWTKVLPPHFLAARETALLRAQEYEASMMAAAAVTGQPMAVPGIEIPTQQQQQHPQQHLSVGATPRPEPLDLAHQDMYQPAAAAAAPPPDQSHFYPQQAPPPQQPPMGNYMGEGEEAMVPMDEPVGVAQQQHTTFAPMDPPEGEPPSLSTSRSGSGSGDGKDGTSRPPPAGGSITYSSSADHGSYFQERVEYLGSSSPEKMVQDYHQRGSNEFHEGSNDYRSSSNEFRGGTSNEFRSSSNEYRSGSTEFHTGSHEFQEGGSYVDGSEYHEGGESDYYTQKDQHAYLASSHEESPAIPEQPLSTSESRSPDREPSPSVTPRRIDTSFEMVGGGHGTSSSKLNLKSELPPTSPASELSSHTSPAMRGAQELLKRNRQRRLEMAMRKSERKETDATTAVESPKEVISPQSEVSGATWESGSEMTSPESASSSVWTENTPNPDRSSRRALILQMAKARMKSNKPTAAEDAISPRSEFTEDDEEKKLETLNDASTDIDIAGDLD